MTGRFFAPEPSSKYTLAFQTSIGLGVPPVDWFRSFMSAGRRWEGLTVEEADQRPQSTAPEALSARRLPIWRQASRSSGNCKSLLSRLESMSKMSCSYLS